MVSNRTQTFLAVVFAVLLLPAGVAVAQTLSTHSATAGTDYVTNSDVQVKLTDDRPDVKNQPFASNTTWTDKDVRISGNDSYVEISDATYSSDPVSVENVEVTGNLTVERTDLSRSFTITDGDATQIQLRDYALGDNETDLA